MHADSGRAVGAAVHSLPPPPDPATPLRPPETAQLSLELTQMHFTGARALYHTDGRTDGSSTVKRTMLPMGNIKIMPRKDKGTHYV